MLLVLLPIALVLLGLGLIAIGLRGRCIDDHPICRRCRFDLVATPLAADARCPECGAAVGGSPDAIRIGNRVRRGRALLTGALLLVLTTAATGALAWSARSGFNWNTVKPQWLLVRQAQGADATQSAAALSELVSRMTSGRVSASTRDALVQAALARQTDATRGWAPEWGDLVEKAHSDGKLSDADWAAYLRGMIDIHVSARPTVRQGDDLAVHAGPGFRGSSKSRVACRIILTDIRLDDTPVSGPAGTYVMEAVCSSLFGGVGNKAAFEHALVVSDVGMQADNWSSESLARNRLPADVPPGTHTLRTTWVLTIGAPTAAMGPGGVSATSTWTTYSWGEQSAAAPLAAVFGISKPDQEREPDMADRLMKGEPITFSGGPSQVPMFTASDEKQYRLVTLEVPVRVLAPDAADVELVSDESLRADMRNAITVTIGPSQYNPTPGMFAVISIKNPPVDGAFDVYQRTSKGERRLGCIVGRRENQGIVAELALRKPVQRAAADGEEAEPTYDLIFRPSAATARKTREVTRIWGLEEVFEGLKAEPPRPGAAQPAGEAASEQGMDAGDAETSSADP